MKPYGHKRYDQIACKYGCCTTKYGAKKDGREWTDKSRRKTARQSAKQTIFTDLLQE